MKWKGLKARRGYICAIARLATGETYTTITAARKALRRVRATKRTEARKEYFHA